MKRSHTIKIEDLQNSLLEGSIEEISQEQAKKIAGGFCPDPPNPPNKPPKNSTTFIASNTNLVSSNPPGNPQKPISYEE
ncbi:MAG: hypothetical protein RLZZ574_1892 [Cyanobacteriota bacterium]|jgi:hypothetical protein